MDEQWKQYDESKYREYYVSNKGKVKSINKSNGDEFMMKLRINKPGYYMSQRTCYKTNTHKHFSVHRLVAQAFIPNPLNKPMVNHIDGDKLNNNVDNLEWATHKENMAHAVRAGLTENCKHYGNAYSKGGKQSGIKVKAIVIDYDGNMIGEYNSVSEALKANNVKAISNNRGKHQYRYNKHVGKAKKKLFIHADYYNQLSDNELNDILNWAKGNKAPHVKVS